MAGEVGPSPRLNGDVLDLVGDHCGIWTGSYSVWPGKLAELDITLCTWSTWRRSLCLFSDDFAEKLFTFFESRLSPQRFR